LPLHLASAIEFTFAFLDWHDAFAVACAVAFTFPIGLPLLLPLVCGTNVLLSLGLL